MKNEIPDGHQDSITRTPVSPMIVRCAHCNGLMKVDEGRIQSQPVVRLRCPHCKKVGLAPHVQAHTAAPERKPSPPAGPVARESTRGPAPAASQSRRRIPIPRDESEEFRFPAEVGTRERKKPFLSMGWRIIIWLAASLGVLGAFALLVNLILPGPPR